MASSHEAAARGSSTHSTCEALVSARFGVSTLAAAVAIAIGGNAIAQERVLEEVTVTGSRIQRESGFTTATPVTAVTPDQLSTLQPGTTIADQLDQLPQFFLTESAQRGGGALFGSAGRSNINMRAMGAERTLVLLDGARLSPGDRNGSVHVDNIPTGLLQQVEVVTGGASAAYGADALAGVTNFILNREYEGFDVNLGLGATETGYGEQHDLSIVWGTQLGSKWHFIGSVEDQYIGEIKPEPNELGDWFQRYGFVGNPDPNGPARLILPDVHSTVHTPTGRIFSAVDATGSPVPFSLNGFNFTYDGTGVVPFRDGDVVGTSLTGTQSGGPEAAVADAAFGGGPYGAEVIRQNLFTGFTFDANDTTRFFANLFGGKTESNQWDYRGIPHGTFPWNAGAFVDNPYLPAGVRQAMIDQGVDYIRIEKQGQVLGQQGNWDDSEDAHNEYRGWTLQLGLDKDLGDNWNFQARLQRGSTDRYTTVYNEDRIDKRYLAMDPVEVYTDFRDVDGDGIPDLVAEADRGIGTIICNVQRYNPTQQQLMDAVAGFLVPAPQGDASLGGPGDRVPIPGPIGPDDVVRDCVPMNIFGQGNVSGEAAAYVASQKAGDSAVTQEFAELLLTGDIYQGWGPGAFSMAVGATWREQWFWQTGLPFELMKYGPPRNAPNIGIRGIAPGYTGGSPNLHEFSTVPTISGRYDVWEAFTEFNFPLWDNGSQRLEVDLAGRYSDYSTSGGIVSNKTGINFQLIDSLRFRATASRDVREPTFAERFDRQGGGGNVDDPVFGGQNFEITTTNGGNPNLEPEEADTVTAGFVIQPTGAPGFQFSMDWYEIDLSGAVGQLTTQNIVTQCFQTGNPEICALVRRDPNTNEITNVDRVFLNIDQAKVRGIDYELSYRAEPNLFSSQNEQLSLRLLAGRLLEDSTTVQGGTPDDRSGRYDEPDFTAVATLRYQAGAYGINLQERYIPESILNHMWVEGVDVDDNTVQSKAYTDLTFLYDAASATGQNWQASFSITNLFDVDPPVIASFSQRFSAQSFGAVSNNYDVYGRRYLLSFRYSF